ncbi:MAG TPA: DUF1015 domain-containing protein, partial [Alphaproteobacteria bacterium]|nr:DUF1015 domain-containing protein [Alphaproteobacteria bacterium]
MADILPFRALRYDTQRVQLEKVVTQPHEQITPEMQARYYESSPHNLVRVVKGRPGQTDNSTFNVYTRGAEYLHDWVAGGYLRRDNGPSVYVYSHTFTIPGTTEAVERRCLIALGRVYDASQQTLFPFQETIAATVRDRLDLLRATQTTFGPISTFYTDSGTEVERILRREDDPEISVLDEADVLHRIWRISSSDDIITLQRVLGEKLLLLAQGHHSYQAAVAYRNDRRKKVGSEDANAPHEFTMMAFIRWEAPGFVMQPVHRVLHGLATFDRERMLESLAPFFEVSRIDIRAESRSATTLLKEAGEGGTTFVAVMRQGAFLLRAKTEAVQAALRELAPRLRGFDVVQLETILLRRILGLSPDAVQDQNNLRYERDAFAAISW